MDSFWPERKWKYFSKHPQSRIADIRGSDTHSKMCCCEFIGAPSYGRYCLWSCRIVLVRYRKPFWSTRCTAPSIFGFVIEYGYADWRGIKIFYRTHLKNFWQHHFNASWIYENILLFKDPIKSWNWTKIHCFGTQYS